MPLVSRGGIAEFEFGLINVFRVAHQSLEESVSDFSLPAICHRTDLLKSEFESSPYFTAF